MSDRLRSSGFPTRLWAWPRAGGVRLADVLVAVAVAVPVFVPFAVAPEVTPLGVVLNLGTVVPLVWRRRAPFAIALVVACFTLGASLHDQPGQALQYGALVAIYSLADLGRHRWQRWGFIGVLVTMIPPGAIVNGNDATEFMFTLILPMTAFLLGTLARTARERTDALAERSAQLEREREALEREREAEAARAAAEERTRIARDMHDVLAHAVSIMVVQAEAGPVVVRTDPAQAERVFEAIGDAGRDAMAQLRRMLGLLKEEQDHGARAPQPTIGALPGLVEHVDRTQVRVRLTVEGVSRDLAPDADLAAYRIVQEALTNTVKHANAREARVELRWTDHELEITVTDDGQGHEAGDPGWRRGGDGLIGIGERAAACGGTAETGPLPGGGFRVFARFPHTAAVAE